jgi:hypothetical protein
MKKLFVLITLSGALFIILAVASCTPSQPVSSQSDLETLKKLAGPPPASLDQYFPPKTQTPVYLIEMFNLATPFEGIGINLQEQDMANVKASFNAFRTQYDKVSRMVPEWTSSFPAGPVDDLGKAIDSGNPAQIGPAMGKLGEVCGSCHLVNQVKVQQKYHWKNFDDIKVTNPVTKQEQKFVDYMTTMAMGFDGAMVDLQEGKLDKAKANYQAFTQQFNTMVKDACKQGHQDPTGKEIPRKYFVDPDSLSLVDQLGKALSATPPDGKAVGDLAGAIGNNICLGCHLVHLPAQVTKDTWAQYRGILK